MTLVLNSDKSLTGIALLGTMLIVFCTEKVSAGLSGDVFIDSTMGSAYNYRAGGSGGAIDRGSNTLLCGSSGAHPNESKCPNDATYTPAAATGGYQAWGVGTAAINFGIYQEECFLVPVYCWWCGDDPYPVWVWTVECETVVQVIPVGTFGTAMAVVKWGETVGSTTAPFSPEPTSVVAFHESLATPCAPLVIGPIGFCANLTDSSHVADNGYEIDIVIDDPMCNTLTGQRLGTQSDFDSNCFTYHQHSQVSNLPAAYKDTTFLDSEDQLVVGFGSAEGVEIDPGTTYIVRQFFNSKVQPVMNGRFASHVGSISTEAQTNPVCIGSGFDPAFCFFSIDTASVGGASDTFDFIPSF